LNKNNVVLLAIESSCDDTSASILIDGKVISNIIANQTVHKQYGGVIPEMASRQHLLNIIPTIDTALKKANITKNQLTAIAFTRGPGLLGSLIVGVSTAKALALSLDIPLIEVHHMHAHVLANFAEERQPIFPFLCLTVSGGHTQIVLVSSPIDMTILGSTIDDAAGEAFDKTGKIIGLPYPAGPEIDKLAQLGNPVFSFAEPKIQGLDFSFSGLKTSILYFLQKQMKENPNFIHENRNDICASVQVSIVDILINKLIKASKQTGIKEVAIAGGVSANSQLRKQLISTGEKLGWNVHIPRMEYCTDNAGMIAIGGYYKYLAGEFVDHSVKPMARLDF